MGLFLFTNVFCLLTLLIILLNFVNMGKKIILSEEQINEIKNLYLSGIGSTTISNNLKLPKAKILKILNENNILRNRLLSDEFYKDFWEENGMWFGYWECVDCNEKILFSVNEKSLLNRNLKRKKICKKCSLNKQIGEGNPFYGKKHTEKTINKISNTKIGVTTSDHMSKPKYRKMFSDMAKKRWANGSMEETRIKLSKLMKERIASGHIKGYIRSKAEDELINILKNKNILVEPNYLLEGKIFDLYIPSFNLLIEYNGDYWHCNPKKYDANYFNIKKNKTAKELWEYDANKLYLAKKNAYNCEVIWETEYKNNKYIILDLIDKYNIKNK